MCAPTLNRQNTHLLYFYFAKRRQLIFTAINYPKCNIWDERNKGRIGKVFKMAVETSEISYNTYLVGIESGKWAGPITARWVVH